MLCHWVRCLSHGHPETRIPVAGAGEVRRLVVGDSGAAATGVPSTVELLLVGEDTFGDGKDWDEGADAGDDCVLPVFCFLLLDGDSNSSFFSVCGV